MTRADLAALLRAAQMHNLNRGITGALLHRGDRFLQYLEGPQAEVQALYARIAADGRHGEIVKLIEGPVARRLSGSWSMNFQEWDAGPGAGSASLNALLEKVCSVEPAPDGRGTLDDAVHRFWSEHAQALHR